MNLIVKKRLKPALGLNALTLVVLHLILMKSNAMNWIHRPDYYQKGWSSQILNTLYGGMACYDQVNLSLDTSGMVTITPAMLLLPPNDPLNYTVTVEGKGTNKVTCADVGYKLKVAVIENTTQNKCWSYVLIEHKTPPAITCKDTTVLCSGSASTLDSISGVVTAVDACTPKALIKLSHIDQIKSNDCTNDTFSVILRNWTAIDPWNRVATCKQTIKLLRAKRMDIVYPRDTVLYCPDKDVSVAKLGQPTIHGRPLDKFCGWIVNYEDNKYDKCGSTFKILRVWKIFDCCALSDTSVTQFINVIDTTRPHIVCKPTDTVNTNIDKCSIDYRLTTPRITDACSVSGAKVLVIVDGKQTLPSGYIVNLLMGVHTLKYDVYDDCGNTSSCAQTLTVLDRVAPILTCVDTIFISAPEARIPVKNFSSIEAIDNCGLAGILARRTTDACADGINDLIFRDSIGICCADINKPFTMVFMATDMAGNTDSCRVKIYVTDKTRPILACTQHDTVKCNQSVPTYIDPKLGLSDNCNDSVKLTTISLINTLNSCGIGTISRKIIATDLGGNKDSCTQSITVLAVDTIEAIMPIGRDTIKIVGCAASIAPVAADSPTITGTKFCHKIAISFVDTAQSTIGTSRCAIIKRTWRVVDTCLSLSPVLKYVQILIKDTSAFLTGTITGQIMTIHQEPVSEVHVMGIDPFNTMAYDKMTGQDGYFENKGKKLSYLKMDKEETNSLNGVSTIDLIRIQQHILGKLPFDNELDKLIADINQDGSINVHDLILLRKFILGTNLENEKLPWVFLDSEALKANLLSNDIYKNQFLVPDQFHHAFDFIGYRMGDVNHDVSGSNAAGVEIRNKSEVNLMGSERDWKIVNEDVIQTSGFQLSMDLPDPPKDLLITSEYPFDVHWSVHNQELRITATGHHIISIDKNSEILRIEGAHPKTVTPGKLKSEWYDAEQISHPIGIGLSLETDRNVIVFPNPAKEYVDIRSKSIFNSFKILDENGRVVMQGKLTGTSSSRIGLNGLSPGLYVLDLMDEMNHQIIHKKIVKY